MASLFIRGVNDAMVLEFKTNAGARGLKHAQYIEALITLHFACKEKSRTSEEITELLDDIGLAEIVT